MMRGLQHLVCKSAIDPSFRDWLARSPVDAVRGFDLADDEVAMILALRPQTADDLAAGVEAWRRGEALPLRAPSPVWQVAPAILAG
jgi:hypothetical protein